MGVGSTEQNPFAPPSEEADFAFAQDAGGYRLATYGQRLAGSMVDGILYVAAAVPGASLALLVGERASFGGAGLGMLLLAIYQWSRIAATGQSLAKAWLHTRIIRENGERPGFVAGVVLRSWVMALLGMIPFIGYLVGLADALAIFSGTTRQTLHDRIAHTLVVQDRTMVRRGGAP
jgi:uncharacterized RDD family membrane protein YckC